MNKIVYKHEICECGKCHCMSCAIKEAEEEPDFEEFKRFLNELLVKRDNPFSLV